MAEDHRFPKSLHVLSSRSFGKILREGGTAAASTLVVAALPRSHTGRTEPTRIGITIPQRTGNAVTRNRWKRLIREAFRHSKEQMPVGYDLIVRPKKGAEANYQCIMDELPRVVRRAAHRSRSH
ncbi:MAG: ribonuclease P protein component [Planctomycetota bacterium]